MWLKIELNTLQLGIYYKCILNNIFTIKMKYDVKKFM